VFGIERSAAPKKRGLFRAKPDARELAGRLDRLLGRMERGAVVRSAWKKQRFVIELQLHDAAPTGRLVVHDDAEITLEIATRALGPGYHADVVERLERVFEELDVAWLPAEADDYIDHRDFARLQADTCASIAAALRAGETRLDVARRFRIDAAVLTQLGPRDAAWRDAVLADPARAADALPWFERGPGTAERARALLALWHDVPWREPLDDDERALMKRVDADLRAARRADGELALPYAAWEELHALLGVENELAVAVRERARGEPSAPPIGYRRCDLDVELSGGWWIALPGTMVGRWEDDGERYWATDGDRAVEFTSLTAPGETDSARLLAVAPAQHPIVATLDDGNRAGRAEAQDDGDVRIIYGFVADAPDVALLTCKCARADEPWALATWRSLHREA
jgi:hypothetical protein